MEDSRGRLRSTTIGEYVQHSLLCQSPNTLLEGTFCVVPAHKEHCVCVCACGGDPPFSRTENYGECDDISVGVTGTKPRLLVGMCVEWKLLSPGVSRP